ncbi:hypothetical protein Mesil_3575 (plasmid) [Allomeiothermus silvanus DSM 9946]|uniref:Uncharacterized protein n=1 Tax=Allomeiothermus silvanus (strain ATCC 700542 / DSM 9946 / NBRC 106475 / NCIMB 13440 / VI-R2) TaxID=526227 RepID=D7BJL1_ALLS1|nr:hypothetical protein [Allomeiothermus silvanus]ADH65367.1 hypothetical protein Mesil_3575 [Allomeiothermus silvanus DSM 9946]
MSVILQHQMASRIVFEDGWEGIVLLSSLRKYRDLMEEAERVFSRKHPPDYLIWRVFEPIVPDPPPALLEDLRTRGVADQIYEADRYYLSDYDLYWPANAAIYVNPYEGAIVRGTLEGRHFHSDPLRIPTETHGRRQCA